MGKIASVVRLRGSIQCPCPGSFPAWESSSLTLRRLPVGLMGALVRNIMPERRAELLSAVSEQLHTVGPARDGNIGHTVVEQVFRAKFRVHVDEHAVGGLSMAGMT